MAKTVKITVTLTENQVYAIIRDLEFEMVDRGESTAYEEKIVELLKSKLREQFSRERVVA